MGKKDENEIAQNCAGCKKALNPATRYYRNNAYFCNLNCYKKKIKADAAKAAEAAAA
ncbi:MAG: hypothetical protein K8S27_03420 [Candidatus Omnitrophica bacterium]|nr:hypothetical protein [Candidatus Omnitrophota bacterium]